MQKPKKPVFITGYPRSGTALLRAILGSHTRIHIYNEPELIGGLRSAGLRIRDFIRPEDRARVLGLLNRSGACRRHLLSLAPEVLSRFVENGRDPSFKDAYELLLPKPEGVAVWGEKSLNNVFHIREIYGLYPEALIVNIVRDPRSALLSYYRKRFSDSAPSQPVFGRHDIHFFVYRTLQWCTWIAAIREARESLGKQILELRYEDLVTNPDREIALICSALGVEYDRDMLDATHRKEDVTLKGNAPYAHKKLLDPIDSARANSGKELPAWACFIVERYAREAIQSFGYTLDCPAVSVLPKLRLVAELRLAEPKMRAKLRRTVTTRLGSQFDYLVP